MDCPEDTATYVHRVGRTLISSVLLSSSELSDTQVYEPYIRAIIGTASHFCKVVVLNLRLDRQVDCPEDTATYVHRVGRTARNDSKGKSLLLLTEPEAPMAALLQVWSMGSRG